MDAAALRWLREDVDIPDSKLYITLSDFEVIYLFSYSVTFLLYSDSVIQSIIQYKL